MRATARLGAPINVWGHGPTLCGSRAAVLPPAPASHRSTSAPLACATAFLFVSLAHRPRCHSPAPLDRCACMTTAATPAINLTQRRHSLPQLARCAASCCSGRRVLELACRVWLCATPSAAVRVYCVELCAVANRAIRTREICFVRPARTSHWRTTSKLRVRRCIQANLTPSHHRQGCP